MEHNNRLVFYIDNQSIAAPYHPYYDNEEGTTEDPWEIHFHEIYSRTDNQNPFQQDQSLITRKTKIQSHLNFTSIQLFYSPNNHYFCAYSEELGTALITLDGEVIFHNPDFTPQKDNGIDKLICYTGKDLSIYQISI